MNVWIKEAKKKLIAARGGKCVECGSVENLEFAHICRTELKGRGRGRKERYYDVVKNPDAYALRCTECHKRFDVEAKKDGENSELSS
jgi:hypothetical protein